MSRGRKKKKADSTGHAHVARLVGNLLGRRNPAGAYVTVWWPDDPLGVRERNKQREKGRVIQRDICRGHVIRRPRLNDRAARTRTYTHACTHVGPPARARVRLEFDYYKGTVRLRRVAVRSTSGHPRRQRERKKKEIDSRTIVGETEV